MPSLSGKKFSQNSALYTIWTISYCGNISKGSVFTIALVLSFTVLIYHSTSGRCSSLLVIFTFMPCSSMWFLMHSNCWSLSICFILNPLPWYVSMICCIDFIIVDFISFFIISAVPKRIACEVDIMKGISLMYIILMAIVTSPCSLSIPFGRLSTILSTTLSGVFHVVFTYRLLKFGPKMSSLVIGSLGLGRSLNTWLSPLCLVCQYYLVLF